MSEVREPSVRASCGFVLVELVTGHCGVVVPNPAPSPVKVVVVAWPEGKNTIAPPIPESAELVVPRRGR